LVIQGLDANLVFLQDNFTKAVCVLITSIEVSKNNVHLESASNEVLERLCLSLSSRLDQTEMSPH